MSSTCARFSPVSTNAGMRREAARTMISPDGVAVPDITFHELTAGVVEVGSRAGAPHQGPYRITGAPERLDDRGADESARARDEDRIGSRTGRLYHLTTGNSGSASPGGWG